jgi:signal transduction histidine kinase/DNA-binding NarL/FixJ family response regulator/HPt (histidine-containing phosphotransfer) domain-containing protein
MLGVDETRLVGHRPREFGWTLADGSAVEPNDQPWQRSFATGKPQRDVHLNVARDDGVRFSLRANCSPLTDARSGVQAMVVSFQDVTELEKRGEALRIAKEEADAANQAKSQFLANMSHEIRTPMNAILGFTDVLRRSALRHSSDAAKHLDIIQSSGNHLLNLINDILDLSKVESGRFQAERIAFAPHKVASEVVTTLAERAREKGLELSLQFPHALPAQVEADPARLRQILTNLIGNAIKFTERGSVTVVLRLERTDAGNHYRFDVKDTGIGIAADKLDTVFDPFVQAEASTTRRFGGTGLGLTISRGFARAMGGDIDVQSVFGEGTTFSVWLDAGSVQGVEMLEPQALESAAEAPAPLENQHWKFPPARVLVVDDSEHNRSLVRLLLEEVGLRCDEAENGRVAVERVAAEPFDLVLMDMQMPEMDGSTATRTLRDRGHTLPIVALTANVMKGFERELEEAGFSGYQTKPIDRDALMRDLAERLGGEPVAGEPPAAPAAVAPAPAVAADDDTPITSRLAGHARLARIVARFVAELPARLERMDAAATASDMEELAAQAHWLKGSGGSMGFDELYEPSLALEHAAKAGDGAVAAQTLAELHRIAKRIERGAPAVQTELAEANA